MKAPKVVRWLRSRPLARARRNLATEKRIRAGVRTDAGLSAEITRFYDREFRRLAGLDKVER
jgi:hypothetical protein